jgi:hypothetical protein
MQGYPGENLSSSSSFASLPEKLDRGRETVGHDSKPSSPLPNYGHKRTLSSSAASVGNQQVRQTERNQTVNWAGHAEHAQGESREASGTIEDLRMEVTTSKRQSLKLSDEVEDLNRKLEKSMQVSKQKEMEVSALTAEREGLKQEVEKLKLATQTSRNPENGADESRLVMSSTSEVYASSNIFVLHASGAILVLEMSVVGTREVSRFLLALHLWKSGICCQPSGCPT